MSVYYCNEVSPSDLSFVGKNDHDNNSFSIPIIYKEDALLIQTPWLVNVFGLSTYRNKGKDKQEFSIELSMNPKKGPSGELLAWLESVDKCMESLKDMEDSGVSTTSTYVSPIKYSERFDPFLRVKVYSNETHLQPDFYLDDEKVPNTKENCLKNINRNCKCQIVMEMNPLWIAPDKYGYSFKARAINVIKELKFRR